MERKVGKYLSLSLMAVVAVFIVLVSYAVVWSDDDITYQYSFADFDHHITSLRDVIESQNGKRPKKRLAVSASSFYL
ncbi:MAG: hypothetical protein ACI304_09270, partial [Lepagella sp.]